LASTAATKRPWSAAVIGLHAKASAGVLAVLLCYPATTGRAITVRRNPYRGAGSPPLRPALVAIGIGMPGMPSATIGVAPRRVPGNAAMPGPFGGAAAAQLGGTDIAPTETP
jgi:hypothetical protein